MKQTIINIAFASLFLLATSTVSAAGANPTTKPCQPVYGTYGQYGGSCPPGIVVINKTVQNPDTKALVDNLGVNDSRFSPEETVSFRITVTNTGQSLLEKVTVKDVLPQYVTFVSGAGNFDADTKTLTFDVLNLNPGESRTFSLAAKVVMSSDLPSDQAVICIANQVNAAALSQTVGDSSSFCIEHQIPGKKGGQPVEQPAKPTETKGGQKIFPKPEVTTTPETGPEALVLFGLLPLGALGRLLQKKSQV